MVRGLFGDETQHLIDELRHRVHDDAGVLAADERGAREEGPGDSLRVHRRAVRGRKQLGEVGEVRPSRARQAARAGGARRELRERRRGGFDDASVRLGEQFKEREVHVGADREPRVRFARDRGDADDCRAVHYERVAVARRVGEVEVHLQQLGEAGERLGGRERRGEVRAR